MSYIHTFKSGEQLVLDQDFALPFKTAYALAETSGFGVVKLLADSLLTADQLEKLLEMDIATDEFDELVEGWSAHSEKSGGKAAPSKK